MRTCRHSRAVLSAAVAAAVSCLTGAYSQAANIPIVLTPASFNYNTVVTAGTPGSSATIVGGSSATVDTENGITFWGPSYNTSGALTAAGTPFVSSANSGTQFVFSSFTANNTLLINADTAYSPPRTSKSFAPPYAQTGTLSLANPAAYSTLAILYTAAGQNYYSTIPPIDYTLSFADGSSYNNSGTAAFAGYGWNDSRVTATSGKRVALSSGGTSTNNNWYMHEADISIPTAEVGVPLTGISFFDSGSGYYGDSTTWGNDPNSLAIYALSGSPSSVPEPASGAVLALAALGAMVRRPKPDRSKSGSGESAV